MCGIFGLIMNSQEPFGKKDFSNVLEHLFLLSETRGKDASGVMVFNDSEMTVLKRPVRANRFIHSFEYRKLIQQFVNNPSQKDKTLGFMGHARMVTNGSEEDHPNNQPVIRDEMVMLHNGIVVNDEELWRKYPSLERAYVVDSEVILAIMGYYLKSGDTFFRAFERAWEQLQGANSIALMNAQYDAIILATSNGSLYFATSEAEDGLVFASEKYILGELLKHPALGSLFGKAQVAKVEPGTAYVFPFDKFNSPSYSLTQQNNACIVNPVRHRGIHDINTSRLSQPQLVLS